MHGRNVRFPKVILPVLAATLLASCDTGNPTGPRFLQLLYVSGDHQVAEIGAALDAPLVVRTQDQNGVPIPGVPINWQVSAGGGSFVVASTLTDESGQASAIYRLGNSLGTHTVTARTSGSQTPITFSVQGIPAPPSQLRVVSGDDQTATVGTELPNPLTVLVTDDLENPKAGVTIEFAVASGGGTLSNPTAVTNAQGLASVVWTLGPLVGVQSVVASSQGLTSVPFLATATPVAPDP